MVHSPFGAKVKKKSYWLNILTVKFNNRHSISLSSMAILHSCCFWRSVRKGSYASVIYTLVSDIFVCPLFFCWIHVDMGKFNVVMSTHSFWVDLRRIKWRQADHPLIGKGIFLVSVLGDVVIQLEGEMGFYVEWCGRRLHYTCNSLLFTHYTK